MKTSTTIFIAVWVCTSSFSRADIIQDGLTHWYAAENNVLDSAGAADGFEWGNVLYSTGVHGQAFDFSEGSAVNFDQNLIPNSGNFSIGLWAKRQDGALGLREFFSQASNVGDHFYMGIDHRPNVPTDYYRVGDSWGNTGVATLTDTQWHHFAFVNDAGNGTFYIDGIEVASTNSFLNPAAASPGGIFIGAQYNGGEQFFGMIDEVTIYNRALSAHEIRSLAAIPEPCSAIVSVFFVALCGARRSKKRC